MKTIALALLVVALGACTSSVQNVSMPDPDADLMATGRCRIYAFCRAPALGPALMVRIEENKRLIGRIGGDCYVSWDTSPGRKLITAIQEQYAFESAVAEGSLDVRLAPGSVNYCSISLEGGLRHPRVELVPPEQGARWIRTLRHATVER